MKLHVLGCGDAFGSGGRHQSGYLFEADGRWFLLNCGPTTLLAMKRGGFAPQKLDAIILSHLHGDHFGGLPFLFIEFLHKKPPENRVIIAGPPATEERVLDLIELMYPSAGSARESSPFRFQVLLPETKANIQSIEVFPFRVPHQSYDISLGLKVSCGGKQILFSGDSVWTDRFIDQARGVDLFLCECSFYDHEPGMHVNFQLLHANLPRLECKRLVITHLGDEMLAHRAQLPVTVAEDGMVIEF